MCLEGPFADDLCSLHNISEHSATTPLVIWIPPFSFCDGYDPASILPPRWLQQFPIATINYRWPGLFLGPEDSTVSRVINRPPAASPTPLHWPTPLHDILFGYRWILEHLAPPELARRDIYVYGSYLGASLAASLALTEAQSHEPMAVRGLIAYNGIYNWTTFLPDHPINRPKDVSKGKKKKTLAALDTPSTDLQNKGSPFHLLRQQAPLLFHDPSHLFDPFASAALLFHTSGLAVPSDFHRDTSLLPSDFTSAVNALSAGSPLISKPTSEQAEPLVKATRKAYLTFPPRKSSLQIPPTLLLYDPVPTPASRTRKSTASRRRAASGANSFQSQANDLAGAMIRSVEVHELRDRMKWDETLEDPDLLAEEAKRRVRLAQVGEDSEDGAEAGLGVLDLNGAGEEAAGDWLRARVEGEDEY